MYTKLFFFFFKSIECFFLSCGTDKSQQTLNYLGVSFSVSELACRACGGATDVMELLFGAIR